MNEFEKLHSPHRCMKPGEPKNHHHQNLLAPTLQGVGQKGHEIFSSSVMARRRKMSASASY